MGSSKDLLAKLEEAAKHPKALLFGAIGAECPTPTKAASKAEALGLSEEEEKLAKRVAVLKRDSQSLFGKSYLEVLAEITKRQEEEGMEIQKVFLLAEDGPVSRSIPDYIAGYLKALIFAPSKEEVAKRLGGILRFHSSNVDRLTIPVTDDWKPGEYPDMHCEREGLLLETHKDKIEFLLTELPVINLK